jgi:hypothetical protein
MNIKKYAKIFNEVAETVSKWNKYADMAGVPSEQAKAIYNSFDF